jgi:glycosylphosphatidylinositol transamidase (GPIT) subunit GPI8
MKNYRITNLKTNVQHFMNEEEKERFLKINNRWYYFAEDMQTIKAVEKQKKKDNILFNVVAVCLMTALYLALCELLNTI